MKITVTPSVARGTVSAPPSKSMAHRLLICGGLAKGESEIRGLSYSEDVLATLDCLSALGATYEKENDIVRICGTDVTGLSGEVSLPCRECGSTLRFMIPICMAGGAVSRLSGSETLMKRPLSVYEDIAKSQGLRFTKDGNFLTVGGRLRPGAYDVPGHISSQFISGLLFALPLLGGESSLRVIPPFESRPYAAMTVSAMSTFGVDVVRDGEYVFAIDGRGAYRPASVTVEGDYSNAAFLEALNLTGGAVKVTGLSEDSLQGDRVYREHFRTLEGGFAEIDISDCPDLGPILFVAAALSNGARFTGTKRLRIKESDRAAAMATELGKFGINVTVLENEVVVSPGTPTRPEVPLDGNNDHRIVMALTVLMTKTGGTLVGAEAVRKSFPDFFEKLGLLGIGFEADRAVGQTERHER